MDKPESLQLLHEAVQGRDWDDAQLLRIACQFIDKEGRTHPFLHFALVEITDAEKET